MRARKMVGFMCPNCSTELSKAPRFCPNCGSQIVTPSLQRVILLNILLFPFYLIASWVVFCVLGLLAFIITFGNALLISDPFWLLEHLPKRKAHCSFAVRQPNGTLANKSPLQYAMSFYRKYSNPQCRADLKTLLTEVTPELALDILATSPMDRYEVLRKYAELLNNNDPCIVRRALGEIQKRGPEAVQRIVTEANTGGFIEEAKDNMVRLLKEPGASIKVPCRECGALILEDTAQKTGGVCMRCR